MSEVKRYSMFVMGGDWECQADDDGEWVEFSDYAQLKAENERLKCVVERLHAELFDEQQRRFEGNRLASEEYHTDTLELRKQLDEARDLLEECSDMADACEDQVLLGHIDAWLEANKL